MASKDEVRTRLSEAAMRGLLAHGPQVTVETIAGLAGVGRRTAFRYFATREELLAAGIEWTVADYLARMPEREERPVEDWLRDLARRTAALMADDATPGPGYVAIISAEWESDAMRSSMQRRSAARRTFSEHVASEAWRAAGRRGRPPRRLVHACLLCLGPFVHYALRADGTLDTDAAARTAGDLLVDVFRQTTGGD